MVEQGIATPPVLIILRRRLAGLSRSLLACGAVALAGCGLDNGPGSWMVDPGRYDAYHCNDLVSRWKQLTVREQELRNLMAKASQGGGGSVIGNVAYRPEYENILSEMKLVQRQAAEKKCELVATFQSDQGIR
jgi:hypothetical protein